ncbi:MAG TPA: hypothetical protein VIY27_11225 [Myxococcota bacterium]
MADKLDFVDTADAPERPEGRRLRPPLPLSCTLRSSSHLLGDVIAFVVTWRGDPRLAKTDVWESPEDFADHLAIMCEGLESVATMLWRAHAHVDPPLDGAQLRCAAENVDSAGAALSTLLVVLRGCEVLDEGDRGMVLDTMADTFGLEAHDAVAHSLDHHAQILSAGGLPHRQDLN